MGGTTIRRLAHPGEMDASVQRFVIQRCTNFASTANDSAHVARVP